MVKTHSMGWVSLLPLLPPLRRQVPFLGKETSLKVWKILAQKRISLFWSTLERQLFLKVWLWNLTVSWRKVFSVKTRKEGVWIWFGWQTGSPSHCCQRGQTGLDSCRWCTPLSQTKTHPRSSWCHWLISNLQIQHASTLLCSSLKIRLVNSRSKHSVSHLINHCGPRQQQ